MASDNEEDYDEDFMASDLELDEEDFWGLVRGRKRKKREKGPRVARQSRPAVFRSVYLNLNREGVYVQRKVRVVDENQPQLLRIPPPPLPPSWCRTVRPYRAGGRVLAPPPAPSHCNVVREPCIAAMEFGALKTGKSFIGVMINPGWVDDTHAFPRDDDPVAKYPEARLANLARLPLKQLCPKGFLFVWLDKVDVQPTCRMLAKQGYDYVENLTWVQLMPNNKLVHDPSFYCRASHLTLYIFRKKNEGKDIQLRHQRSPDVIFECLNLCDEGHVRIPHEVYKSIETLLVTQGNDNEDGFNRLLELWAPSDCARQGWTHVIQEGTRAAA